HAVRPLQRADRRHAPEGAGAGRARLGAAAPRRGRGEGRDLHEPACRAGRRRRLARADRRGRLVEATTMNTADLIRRGTCEWEIPMRGGMRVPVIVYGSEALVAAMDDKVT